MAINEQDKKVYSDLGITFIVIGMVCALITAMLPSITVRYRYTELIGVFSFLFIIIGSLLLISLSIIKVNNNNDNINQLKI